jgi:ketosteroid isomerase-like protein
MVEGEKRMTIGRTGKTVLVIIAAVACFILIKYLFVSDEARIKKVIYKGKAAIEQEDFEGALTHVSRDYQDDYGLNKMAIAALLKRLYAQFDNITIHVESLEVEIQESGLGQASLLTWVTAKLGGETGYIVGNAENPSRVVFILAKEGNQWRVVKSEGVEPVEGLWL